VEKEEDEDEDEDGRYISVSSECQKSGYRCADLSRYTRIIVVRVQLSEGKAVPVLF
jgi:hypothetical protein